MSFSLKGGSHEGNHCKIMGSKKGSWKPQKAMFTKTEISHDSWTPQRAIERVIFAKDN